MSVLDRPASWRSRPWHCAVFIDAPGFKVSDFSMSEAAIRKRASRARQELLDAGYRPALLLLPPEVMETWAMRERSANSDAPLDFTHFEGDMVEILREWSLRWRRSR